MNTYKSICSMCVSIAVLLTMLHMPAEAQRTLQTFGVQVKYGQPVYPLPANIALGLFNPEDPFLDVAYANDGRVQVFQNLGNGLFSDAPVFDRRVSGEVAAMQWRMRNPYFRSPSDLVITYADGREETIANEWMREQTRSFASLPQMESSFPPLNFREVWRSAPNPGGSPWVLVGDIDGDGRTEMVYMFAPPLLDSLSRIVVYESVGNDSFVVEWDTTVATISGILAITDIDNDGHKEIVVGYFPRGINILPRIALLECFGPRQYRFYDTNIGFQRPLGDVKETDVNHDGIKELTVLTSSPSVPQDATLIYVATFLSKGAGPDGWFMSFSPQELARFQGFTFTFAVGQVDGVGRDEIIPAGGSFGFHEPVPVRYLWYSGIPGPLLWKTREIYTGLQSGTGAVMFANLDADTTMEFVSGAPGPVGNGSMFALKYLHDTTWSVMWADSSLRSSPLWVNHGMLNGQYVVAGANVWTSGNDSLYGQLHVYRGSGSKVGAWRLDSASIQQFHLIDIDHDGRTNLVFASIAPYNSRLRNYESDTVVLSVGDQDLLPQQMELSQNYPNPFNPTTIIRVQLSQQSRVTLQIYDLLGKEVRTLIGGDVAAGTHTIQWNGTNNEGGDASSGVYFYRLVVTGKEGTLYTNTKKMILIR